MSFSLFYVIQITSLSLSLSWLSFAQNLKFKIDFDNDYDDYDELLERRRQNSAIERELFVCRML